jgi:uncharacterized membrane protein HdeD (DUF308 family)
MLRGLAGVAFGVLLLVWPGLTLGVFVVLFGVFAIVFGGAAFIAALMGIGREKGWALQLLIAALGIAAGVVALVYPGPTTVVLLYLVAAWAIASGVVEVASAVALRSSAGYAWLVGFIGIISIAFGVVAIAWPGATILGILWFVGAYALVSGVLTFIGSFLLYRRQKELEARSRETDEAPCPPTVVVRPEGAAVDAGAAGHPSVSVADELTKLAALRDAGDLTPEEFEAQKARLLERGVEEEVRQPPAGGEEPSDDGVSSSPPK